MTSGATLAAQTPVESREVRQLVTFRFLPGQTRAALDVYRTGILPIYRGVESMRTVRLLGEVESPEPLDLMVVVGGYNSSNTISLAALCAEQWLDFLDRSAGLRVFREGPGRALADAPYNPGSQPDDAALHDACRQWLRRHR